MDEDTCMVDVARFFMEFVQENPAGRCVACRLGTKRMLEILERITQERVSRGTLKTDRTPERCKGHRALRAGADGAQSGAVYHQAFPGRI